MGSFCVDGENARQMLKKWGLWFQGAARVHFEQRLISSFTTWYALSQLLKAPFAVLRAFSGVQFQAVSLLLP